jgi:hypothetical protein
MAWIYELSKVNRIFKIAPVKFGAKISSNRLYYYNSYHPTGIEIKSIVSIDFSLRPAGDNVDLYFYIIKTQNNKEIELPSGLLEGKEYQRLIHDLIGLNPSINLSDSVQSFLKRELQIKPKFKWDFKVYTGSIKERSLNLSQDYPSYFSFIQLWIFVIFGLLIIGLVAAGIFFLKYKFGTDYSTYRIYCIILGGILVSISLINVLAARFKLYLGHSLTIITFIISMILTFIGMIK